MGEFIQSRFDISGLKKFTGSLNKYFDPLFPHAIIMLSEYSCSLGERVNDTRVNDRALCSVIVCLRWGFTAQSTQ